MRFAASRRKVAIRRREVPARLRMALSVFSSTLSYTGRQRRREYAVARCVGRPGEQAKGHKLGEDASMGKSVGKWVQGRSRALAFSLFAFALPLTGCMVNNSGAAQ